MPAARSRGRVDDGTPKPRSDAYVGLLGLSLLALGLAMLFAFLNWNLIAEKPKPVQAGPSAGGGGGARTAPPAANPANPKQPVAPGGAQPQPAPAGGQQPAGKAPPPMPPPQKK
ncbi:MAG TPA: hypothetical protein VMG10_18445 [Gemmataceae bacterium]|nr:hypothetical protein [Gemmataceae bacterium]